LAVPDLIFNAYFIKVIVKHTTLFIEWSPSDGSPYPHMEDDPYDFKVSNTCMAINMYLNAFLAHEIYTLLKKSQARIRYHPPTIAKVTIQAIVSYGIGVALLMINFFKTEKLYKIISAVEFFISLVMPLLYLTGITFVIYKKGLLTATESMHQGRLRVLTIYFSRIIGVYLLVIIPLVLLYVVGIANYFNANNPDIAYGIAMLIAGSQVPISFACCLTKPDARKLIVDLFCCYIGNNNSKADASSEDIASAGGSNFVDPYLKRRSAITTQNIGTSIPSLQVSIDISESFSEEAENGIMPTASDDAKSTPGPQTEKEEACDKLVEEDIETGNVSMATIPTPTCPSVGKVSDMIQKIESNNDEGSVRNVQDHVGSS